MLSENPTSCENFIKDLSIYSGATSIYSEPVLGVMPGLFNIRQFVKKWLKWRFKQFFNHYFVMEVS